MERLEYDREEEPHLSTSQPSSASLKIDPLLFFLFRIQTDTDAWTHAWSPRWIAPPPPLSLPSDHAHRIRNRRRRAPGDHYSHGWLGSQQAKPRAGGVTCRRPRCPPPRVSCPPLRCFVSWFVVAACRRTTRSLTRPCCVVGPNCSERTNRLIRLD